MNEQEPSINLNFSDGKKMELNRRNATLYTFMGRTAIGDINFENSSINHIFIETGKNDKDQPSGMYIFERFQKVYAELAKFALDHNFPAHLNIDTVPACDLNAYMGQVATEETKFHEALDKVTPDDFKK